MFSVLRFWYCFTSGFSVFAQLSIGFSVLKVTCGFRCRRKNIGGFSVLFRFLSCYKLGSFLHHQMLQELFSLPVKINKITGGSSNISVRRKIYSLLMSVQFQMRFSVFVDFLSGFSVLPPNFVRFCGFENPSLKV